MGSTESLAGALADEQPKESKVFKSAFAKQLEEKRAPLLREVKEGERSREAAWRAREDERRLVVEESRLAEREYCRLKEENASLKLEIMKIQLEDKKYRDLQQEVDLLSAQLRKVCMLDISQLPLRKPLSIWYFECFIRVFEALSHPNLSPSFELIQSSLCIYVIPTRWSNLDECTRQPQSSSAAFSTSSHSR